LDGNLSFTSQYDAGGVNTIKPDRPLTKESLSRRNLYTIAALVDKITPDDRPSRLTAEEIADVAEYILKQAEAGWQPTGTHPLVSQPLLPTR
jgi:cytochrome c6